MSGRTGRIKVGIVGLGYAGQRIHGASLQEMPEAFEIVAGCDTDESRMQEVCGRWGARAIGSLEEVAAEPDIDLVVVTTKPFETHVDQAIVCLEAGKNTVVDKPVAMNLSEARRLADVAKRSGGRLFPHQNQRWNMAFQAFCEVVRSGAVGRPLLIVMHKQMGITADVFHNFASHWVDMAVSLTAGEVLAEVSAVVQDTQGLTTTPGFWEAGLRYASGLTVRISFLPDANAPEPQFWYVAGTEGSYHLNWFDIPDDLIRKQCRWSHKSNQAPPVPKRFGIIDHDEGRERSNTTSVGFYRNVSAALRGEAEQEITVEDIVEQLRIFEAIWQSARVGRAVRFEN